MNSFFKYLIILLIPLQLICCSKLGLYNSNKDVVVASVSDEFTLYESQLSQLFVSSLSDSDSIAIRQHFINDWIRTKSLQYYAMNSLEDNSDLLSHINSKVELYRLQLILYEFEGDFIENNLDTLFLDSELSDYYHSNISSFRLSSPLFKGAIARIPAGVRQSKKLKNLFISKKEDEISEFLEICGKNDYLNLNFVDNWAEISEITSLIPISISKADEIFSKTKFYELNDKNWLYMIRVDDFLSTGSIAPFEMEIDNIKKILLHKRRLNLKKQLEDSVLTSAMQSGIIHRE